MNSGVRQGKDLEKLDGCDIFDKVINLKFTRKNEDTFTIRSDYELNVGKTGVFFTRMQIKPDLKVIYSQVADTTAIAIQIYVTNFHMFSLQESVPSSLSAADNPIVSIQIQMGYFAQFPDFSDPLSGLTRVNYNDLTGGYGKFSAGNGIKTLTCQVLSAYPTKLPPDSITLFDCLVANIGNVFHTAQDKLDTSLVFKGGVSFSDYIYKSITKRYLREVLTESTMRTILTENPSSVTNKEGVTTVYKGCMQDSFADKYGVICYLSPLLQKYVIKEAPPALEQQNNVFSALQEMRAKHFSFLRVFSRSDGNFVLFHAKESLNEVISSQDILRLTTEVEPEIPAVYTITFGAVRTISCPFYTLLNPFQKLHFQSRYNMSNLVGYYYSPAKGEDTMYSIKLQVSFSTTGDENDMLITSVDGSAP